MDHLEWFARDDAYSDVSKDYLFAEDRQGLSKKYRLEWIETSPYSEERYTTLYNKYYDEAVKLELKRAQKILDFYTGIAKKSEPERPIDCVNCRTSYEDCTAGIFKAGGRACCSACGYQTTHAQDAWENWIRGNKERN